MFLDMWSIYSVQEQNGHRSHLKQYEYTEQWKGLLDDHETVMNFRSSVNWIYLFYYVTRLKKI